MTLNEKREQVARAIESVVPEIRQGQIGSVFILFDAKTGEMTYASNIADPGVRLILAGLIKLLEAGLAGRDSQPYSSGGQA